MDGSDRTGENQTWDANDKANKAAIIAFNSDLRYNRGKSKLSVNTSAADRERFETDLNSLGEIHFGESVQWKSSRRITEMIKVHCFDQALKDLCNDHIRYKKTRADTVPELLKWLATVCTKRYDSEQAEAFKKLSENSCTLKKESAYHEYVAELDHLLTVAKVEDEAHRIQYFRNGLPADINADLNLDVTTGRAWESLTRCQDQAAFLLNAKRLKREARVFEPAVEGVPRNTRQWQGNKKPKVQFALPESNHIPSLAVQAEEGLTGRSAGGHQGAQAGSYQGAPAGPGGRSGGRDGGRTGGRGRGRGRGRDYGQGRGRGRGRGQDRMFNEALTKGQPQQLIAAGRCCFCFQPFEECRKNGRCKFYGQNRPWDGK